MTGIGTQVTGVTVLGTSVRFPSADPQVHDLGLPDANEATLAIELPMTKGAADVVDFLR